MSTAAAFQIPRKLGRLQAWQRMIVLWVPLFALLMMIVLELSNQPNGGLALRFVWLRPTHSAVALLLICLFAWSCIGMVGRPLAGMGLAALPLLLIAGANGVKQTVLYDPLFPSDFALWYDFLSVGVNFVKNWQILIVPLSISLPFFGWLVDRRLGVAPLRWNARIALCVAAGLPLVAFVMSPRTAVGTALTALGVPTQVSLTRDAFRESGLFLSFALNISSEGHRIPPPAEYSAETMHRRCAELLYARSTAVNTSDAVARGISTRLSAGPTAPHTPGRVPHVLIIHAESLFPVQDVPGLSFSRDPTPNLGRLWIDSGRLRVLAGQYGGGSIFSEFEATTGFSTMIFPAPYNYPFQLVLPKGRAVPTLAWFFRAHGYRTVVIAPYDKGLQKVSQLYPHMGYQQHVSRESFSRWDYAGRYVSDRAIVNRVLSMLKSSDKPMFIFMATMGSHGPYAGCAQEVQDINVTRANPPSDPAELDGYARTISRLDDAMGVLFEELQELDYPVVVLLYGDHLPGIREIEAAILPADWEGQASDRVKLFTTMAILWSNVGSPTTVDVPPGPRSLFLYVPLLLRRCGLSHPFYTEFLDRVAGEVLGVNHDLYVSADGRASDGPPLEAKSLDLLRTIEYDLFFGQQYSVGDLFPEFRSASSRQSANDPH